MIEILYKSKNWVKKNGLFVVKLENFDLVSQIICVFGQPQEMMTCHHDVTSC